MDNSHNLNTYIPKEFNLAVLVMLISRPTWKTNVRYKSAPKFGEKKGILRNILNLININFIFMCSITKYVLCMYYL